MQNPLLTLDPLPDYPAIRWPHAEQAILHQIADNRQQIEARLAASDSSFVGLVEPLEELQHRLGRVFAPIAHLNAVLNSEESRQAYNACVTHLTDYQTALSQDERLAQAYEQVLANDADTLTPSQRRVVEHTLREFRLAGVRLPYHQKQRFKTLVTELAELQTRFEERVLDATQAWTRHIVQRDLLEGLPDHLVERACRQAVDQGVEGWWLTLDQPTYQAVITHAHAASLRRDVYEAWVTRASDQGPLAGKHDNTTTLMEILTRRRAIAEILGFANFAELALATRMAKRTDEVIAFLKGLVDHYTPAARAELARLEQFAGHPLEPWDVPYYSERLLQQEHALSEEALRPWFPLPRVLDGLFTIATRLYDLRITEQSEVALWHPQARYFAVHSSTGTPIGGFYTDLYARPHKRGGAWMADVTGRKRLGGAHCLPVANLVCNFSPPGDGQPALLTHRDVVTLFHEFGHTLHHLLTQVDYPTLAGINGVPWDAVELPSQLMENWAWQKEALPLISEHVATGQPLPSDTLETLLASRSFHAGLAALRQLEFALIDFGLHVAPPPTDGIALQTLVERLRAEVSVLAVPSFNRFTHSFTHIFSGGYAAGYYSYKWAEVLAADAFSAFSEATIFDKTVANRFLTHILSKGGDSDQMEAFESFRGRKPTIEALLKQDGIAV
jgi:oligopeptidase A